MAKNLADYLGCPNAYYNIAMASYVDLSGDKNTTMILHCEKQTFKITSSADVYEVFKLLDEAIPYMFNLKKLMLRIPATLYNAGNIAHMGVISPKIPIPLNIKTLELLDPISIDDLLTSTYQDLDLIKVRFTNVKISWNKFKALINKFRGTAFWNGSIEHDWSNVRLPKNVPLDEQDDYAFKYYLYQRKFI